MPDVCVDVLTETEGNVMLSPTDVGVEQASAVGGKLVGIPLQFQKYMRGILKAVVLVLGK